MVGNNAGQKDFGGFMMRDTFETAFFAVMTLVAIMAIGFLLQALIAFNS